MEMPDMSEHNPFYPINKLDHKSLRSTIEVPIKDGKIPDDAQWLGGEGAGSWFSLEPENSQLKITRYAPDGKVECTGIYENLHTPVNFSNHHFLITYPSNCKVISLKNQDKVWQFERV
jgi:hypothetical protein